MIVKMKKITLLCVESERTAALERLRKLGIVHVDHETRVESASVEESERTLEDITRIYNLLSGLKPAEGKNISLSGEEICFHASELFRRQDELEKQEFELQRGIESLQAWGEFDPELVERLAEKGIYVLFCRSTRDSFRKLELPENTVSAQVAAAGREICFLVISTEKQDASLYPVVQLPSARLSELLKAKADIATEKLTIGEDLKVLAASCRTVKEYFETKTAEHEFLTNRDGMISDGAIAYLTGYIPADELPKLTEAAHRNGWALTADDPAPDDVRVPTLIRKPGWVKIIDPLFEFIGITPGYRESDVSVFFLIAFPIFFGMLICDSAYGSLFLISALLGKYLLRKKPAAQMPLNLLIILSFFSILFGLLSGSCLGLPRDVLPVWLGGLDFLAEPGKSSAAMALSNKFGIKPSELTNKFTQWFCFLLAALHLSAAHLFKYVEDIRNWRSWGNIGWACLIWGNFFTAVNLIVFPGSFPRVAGFTLYGVGLLLILITVTGEAVLTLPSSLVGSFVDVLSYIRLFAVGLSGMYVASSFNNMGKMVLDSLPKEFFVLGLIGLILVALAGHLLNIVLGFMSVLVHALRLNTLEFSNHANMTWSGQAYRPFANKEKNND